MGQKETQFCVIFLTLFHLYIEYKRGENMGRKAIDLLGQVFGDLTVVARAENSSDNKA